MENEIIYDFTSDYVTSHQKEWLSVLSPFIGKPCRAVEVGSYEGRSALWFLKNILTHDHSRLICYDIWGWSVDLELRFDRNIAASGFSPRVEKRKADSVEMLRYLSGQIDFCYIDGCKDAHHFLSNAVLLWPRLKKGGVMIFDDYGWNFDEKDAHRLPPKIGIDSFMSSFAGQYEVIHKGWQMILKKV